MSKFINRFYAGAVVSLNNGKLFNFENIFISDNEDHFSIYECDPDDTITIIFKSSIVYMFLRPCNKREGETHD